MSKALEKTWQLPNTEVREQLMVMLAKDFSIQQRPGEPNTYSLLEDNDWHLWHSGVALFKTDNHLYLLETQYGSISEQVNDNNSHFWWDFPDGELREQLKQRIGLRALLPVHSMHLVCDNIDILNEDEKIVCRLQITDDSPQQSDPTAQSGQAYLTISALKGYDREFTHIASIFQTVLKHSTVNPNLKNLILRSGLRVKPMANKSFGISADIPAETAVRTMARAMFVSARNHEQGIIDDIDTEFLHDYRIAIRKARSVVNLMKAALPEKKQQLFKSHLAELVRPTNNLRDLDVFILDETHYREMLPNTYHTGLEELFKIIKIERKTAHRQVAKFLKSAQFRKKCTQLDKQLAEPAEFDHPYCRKPILAAAKKRIWKRYQKIRHMGNTIEDSAPDEEVHALRIECKKLRYLMGFFAELFPNKHLKKCNKPLKQLQNILGNFNDCSIQKEFLAEHGKNSDSPELIAAVGGLIAIIHQKQLEERARVSEAFKHFGNDITDKHFKLLFN